MKAITIRQPWASLIAIGEKHYETRSWKTKYRGKIAIHAGLTVDKVACYAPVIASILKKYGLTEHNLPTGQILAICELNNCLKVTRDYIGEARAEGNKHVAMINAKEYFLGDFSRGRYAWDLCSMQPLQEPIHAKGKLSLWEYPVSV